MQEILKFLRGDDPNVDSPINPGLPDPPPELIKYLKAKQNSCNCGQQPKMNIDQEIFDGAIEGLISLGWKKKAAKAKVEEVYWQGATVEEIILKALRS